MLFPLTRTTTPLFVFRVYALYNRNNWVVTFFSLFWLLVLGLSAYVPIGNSAVNIGITKYCVFTRTKSSTSFAVVYPLIHETLVFLATSWALLGNFYADINFKNGFKVMVMGKFLPAFSKSFLHDGQAFYLADLIFMLTFSVAYYDQNFPRELTALFGAPAFVLINNLSCYIYRNVRLGVFRDYSIRTSAINKALESAVLHLHQPSYSSSSSRSKPTETGFLQSTPSVDQDNTSTQVEGEPHSHEVARYFHRLNRPGQSIRAE